MSARRNLQQAVNEATASLQRTVDKQQVELEGFKQGINDLIDKHLPNVSADHLEHIHPGWSDGIDFWCTECRHRWPCSTINDLRAIYGRARGWDPALRPYEPLRLNLAANEEPTT